MAVHRSYTVRPPPKAPRTDLKDALWIHLSPANLLLHSLRPGDACHIRSSEGISKPAMAFDNPKIQDSVVQISKTLQVICGLNLGDSVSISASRDPTVAATSVTLKENILNEGQERISENHRMHWAWLAEDNLQRAEYVCPGMVFDIQAKRQQLFFEIVKINESADAAAYHFGPGSDVRVLVEGPIDPTKNPSHSEPRRFQVSADRVAGLDQQLLQLNYALTAYDDVRTDVRFLAHNPDLQGGILIHGPSGTGKSLLLDCVAEAGWETIIRLNTKRMTQSGGDKYVQEALNKARGHQPSLIIVDGLDKVAGKGSTINLTDSLTDALDHVGGDRILVIAAARNFGDVDDELQKYGRFNFQIETTAPNARSRTEILKLFDGLSKDETSSMLQDLGERTHGYVGEDLRQLLSCARRSARSRITVVGSSNPSENANEIPRPKGKVPITKEDLEHALTLVKPTALREVLIETPNVRWSDIGGQHEVKKSLQEAVEWPLKYPEEMKRLNVKPKKGVLLYGPPGCSKTLVAKALATETDLNFIAVKGAELVSMYVGESERAVRELFRKARTASPSILFFDEIDALGASRDTGHGGLNVLTTLLNELDGIEVLKGVFVLAATNNPQLLDPALIRPGRFSTLFYIGMPDSAARTEILRIQLSKVDQEAGIDFTHLAGVTKGFSGAEVVDICERACEAALRDQIASLKESQITMRHLLDAVGSTESGVTPQQIARYKEWKASRR